MKNFALLICTICFSTALMAQESPRMQADGSIDGVSIAVDYGAPSVKGRTIWGGLEAYGNVWRAGANENTTVSFDKDVTLNGEALAAGKYGFFIIPNENEDWVLIFNKKNDAFGAYSYSQDEDALRLTVAPTWVDDVQEQLMYGVSETLDFGWEKARLSVEVSAQ